MRLVNATPSMSLLLSGALLALGACGDDGDPATPATTTGADGSSGDSTPTPPTDASESVDTTMGPPTEDPTTDDGGTTASTDPPTTTNMTATDTGEGGPISFRLNSIELTDPGAGIGGTCADANMVNGLLAPALSSDMDEDGFLDMAFVLDFEDLDQSDGMTGALIFANAQCEAPDGDTCGLLPMSEPYDTTYSVVADGECMSADPANIMPGTGNTGTTNGPCFVTEPLDATVVTSAVSLPLTDARIAAQFVGDPAGNLVSGTLEGFLSQTDAENIDVEVGISLPLSMLLCPDHMDGAGWWMHMNFTALPTEWTG